MSAHPRRRASPIIHGHTPGDDAPATGDHEASARRSIIARQPVEFRRETLIRPELLEERPRCLDGLGGRRVLDLDHGAFARGVEHAAQSAGRS
jgi:hypothetical protein